MADDNIEDTSPPSSNPYFVRSGCELLLYNDLFSLNSIIIVPFVFLPTTGFNFSNNSTHVTPSDNQTTKKKENDENNEEIEEEEGAAAAGLYIQKMRKKEL